MMMKKHPNEERFLIETPYGRGRIVQQRSSSNTEETTKRRKIQLVDWHSAHLYAPNNNNANTNNTDFPLAAPQLDDIVETMYGRGRVVAVNHTPLSFRIRLSNWHLAGRSTVVCILQKEAIRGVLPPLAVYQMNTVERLEHAQKLKSKASKLFGQQQYSTALDSYRQAVDVVRGVHLSNNNTEMRADLLHLMVTCANNAATCSMLLKDYPQARTFARHALVLLDALDQQRGKKIHRILERLVPNAKLLGTWRAKSCLVLTKASLNLGDYTEAQASGQRAQEIIALYTTDNNENNNVNNNESVALERLGKELTKVQAHVKAGLTKLKKREKQRARAMFANDHHHHRESKEEDEQAPNGQRTPDPTPTGNTNNQNLVEDTPKSAMKKNPNGMKKSVSFSKRLEETQELVSSSDDNEDTWWYQDSEVLIGLGVVVLAGALLVGGSCWPLLTTLGKHRRNYIR